MEPSEVSLFGWESRQLLPLPGFPLMPASARVLEPKSPLRPKLQVPHWRPTLCAHATSVRSRLKPERCRVVQTGLHRTAGHPPLRLPPVTPCHPEPDRLLKQSRRRKQRALEEPPSQTPLGAEGVGGFSRAPMSGLTPTGASIGQSSESCKRKKARRSGQRSVLCFQFCLHHFRLGQSSA